ncbi:MAG: fibronectin type III domain-containing protein [Oscillospiraceae bacterium]|nr:fibronectin type III domain-containing protein [Oscillospiraceae bacterium]
MSWNKVSGATKYKVYYRKADESDYSVLSSNVTGTSYTFKKGEQGTKYCFRVTAVVEGQVGNEGSRSSKNTESEQSDTKSKFTKMSTPTRPSDDVSTTGQITLEWKK